MSGIYGLLGTRLPMHPQAYPNELFSHWFYRLAHANNLKAQTFADNAFGRYSSFWARDQDKLASPEIIGRLSDLTGQHPEDIRALTLAAYEGKIYPSHNAYGQTRWILPLGIYHRTWRLFGLQYCPICLLEDAEPYFRRHWRLVLSTVCDKHGVMMRDRCHHCGAPVTYFRNDLGHRSRHVFRSSACCHACGADLARAPAYDPPGPDGQTLAVLRSLNFSLDMGWWWAGSETIHYGPLFFDVLHHIATLLGSGKGQKLLSEVERRIGKTEVLSKSRPPKGVIEHRSIEDRHWLVFLALWLLQEWPERFVETSHAARMWQSSLLGGERFPYWFERVVKEDLDRTNYIPNGDEARSIAEYMERRGQTITKKSVEQFLGGPDHKVATDFALRPQWHWPETDEEYCLLLDKLDALIRSLRPESVRQLLAERDRTIIQLMKVSGWGAARVLRLGYAEWQSVFSLGNALSWRETRAQLLRYIRVIRPALAGGRACQALFVGTTDRDGIGVDALSHRVKMLLLS